ncbi:MAG: tRNA (adenosine(37)-N6)-threonylcarbamoyltransferase complex dimerization subunit type 1 TsaB [Bdellovibrionota bacterium]
MKPVILAIDTSTSNIVVGICRGNEILCDETFKTDQHQSKHVLGFIDACLRKNNLTLQNVDSFATTSGPGSFTGVRICLGTMKALAFSLSKPLIGIPTLEAMAHAHTGKVAPTLEARKDFVYIASYENTDGELRLTSEPKMVPALEMASHAPSGAKIINSKSSPICGKTLCEIALRRYSRQQFEDVFSVEPLYIQKTAAEGYV